MYLSFFIHTCLILSFAPVYLISPSHLTSSLALSLTHLLIHTFHSFSLKLFTHFQTYSLFTPFNSYSLYTPFPSPYLISSTTPVSPHTHSLTPHLTCQSKRAVGAAQVTVSKTGIISKVFLHHLFHGQGVAVQAVMSGYVTVSVNQATPALPGYFWCWSSVHDTDQFSFVSLPCVQDSLWGERGASNEGRKGDKNGR